MHATRAADGRGSPPKNDAREHPASSTCCDHSHGSFCCCSLACCITEECRVFTAVAKVNMIKTHYGITSRMETGKNPILTCLLCVTKVNPRGKITKVINAVDEGSSEAATMMVHETASAVTGTCKVSDTSERSTKHFRSHT